MSERSVIPFAVHEVRAVGAGASADFEQMLGLLVRATSGEASLVFPNPGDWGIDVLVGDLRGQATVWQARYFRRGVGRSQQLQVKASFDAAVRAAHEHGYALERWVLCIPCSMDAPTMQWWQIWKARQEEETGITIELWDETALRELLLKPEAANVLHGFYGGPASVPDIDSAREALRAGQPNRLLGLAECGWLDVKQGIYQLNRDNKEKHARGSAELAKDVAAFANTQTGGLLLIGFRTRKENGAEIIHEPHPIPRAKVDLGQYRQLISERVTPAPTALKFSA